MKCTIEAINTPTTYQFGNRAPELRIYSLANWITYDRQFIQRGNPAQKDSWYIPIQCNITGGNIVMVPTFELDSTEDAPPPGDQIARYTARLCTAQGRMIGIFPIDALTSFYLPAIDFLTWDMIVQYNAARKLYVPSVTYATLPQVQALIDDAVDLALNSRGQLWGTTPMTAGVAFVSTIQVRSNSIITATGQDSNVTGNLYIDSIVPNVGFTIKSSNGADSGMVGWVIH